MDSLSLYEQYLQEIAAPLQSITAEKKLACINEIACAVVSELNAPPYELDNSSFLAKTADIIKTRVPLMPWKGKGIVIVDALAVSRAVRQSFDDNAYSVTTDEEISSISKFLFKDGEYNVEKNLIANITQNLNDVRNILQNVKASPPATVVQPQQVTPQPAQIKSLSATEVAPPQTQAAIPAKSSTLMEGYAARTNAQIEWQKQLAEFRTDRAEKFKLRREDNRQNVSAWHNEQAEVIQAVKTLQEPAQKLLEQFINFSGVLTENYVVRFASTYIELYNLIAENLTSHAPKAEKSQSGDYYNAVENYKDYLEMIVDALSNFGVEEIASSEGTRFDGKIHDVKNTRNFYPSFATVKRSLRVGFRYGDRILQKEQVEI